MERPVLNQFAQAVAYAVAAIFHDPIILGASEKATFKDHNMCQGRISISYWHPDHDLKIHRELLESETGFPFSGLVDEHIRCINTGGAGLLVDNVT